VRSTRSILLTAALLAAAAVLVAAVSYGNAGDVPSTSAPPGVVEAVRPGPGDLVPRQSSVEVDLKAGYGAELWVQLTPGTWQRVPAGEVTFIEGTGTLSWAPGPGGVVEEWPGGEHRLRVVWDTLTGLPDVGEYEWSFRTY
jgi:hypothetical protein